MELGRRNFLKLLGLGAGAVAAAPLLAATPVIEAPPPPPPLWVPPERKVWALDKEMLVPKPRVVLPEYTKFSAIGETGVYIDGARVASVRSWQARGQIDPVYSWAFGHEAPRPGRKSMELHAEGQLTGSFFTGVDPYPQQVVVHAGEYTFEGYLVQDRQSFGGEYQAEIRVTHAVRNVGGQAHVVHSDGLHRHAVEPALDLP